MLNSNSYQKDNCINCHKPIIKIDDTWYHISDIDKTCNLKYVPITYGKADKPGIFYKKGYITKCKYCKINIVKRSSTYVYMWAHCVKDAPLKCPNQKPSGPKEATPKNNR